MAIRDFNNPMGLLGINNNPTDSLGLNISPTFDARAKQAEEDEAKRKRAEQSLKLQNLADTLRMVNANKSGNTQGVALYSNRLANRRAAEQARLKKEQDKLKAEKLQQQQDAFIKANPEYAGAIRMNQLFGFNPPPAKDRRIVLQNGVQYYADTGQPVIPNAPGKTKTTKQEYDDLAAKIKIEIANNGRTSPNLTKSQLDFYDDYIKTGSINYLNKSIANLISGTTGGQSNSTKNYTVINSAYGSMTANQIIDQAFEMNKEVEPKTTREGVIKNLIANKIISE